MTTDLDSPPDLVRSGRRPPFNEAVLRTGPVPARIQALPVSVRGFPVPWFVTWFEGVPDFRVADPNKLVAAVRQRRCWTCGQPLGVNLSFVLGPMCVVNRTVSEPPSHRDCAVFAARACPFLANPRAQRRDLDEAMRDQTVPAAGIHLERNPGAIAVWTTRAYHSFPVDRGVLFTFDDPTEVLWYAHGRDATRDEVMTSIELGMPALEEAAVADGFASVEQLREMKADALQFLPAPR